MFALDLIECISLLFQMGEDRLYQEVTSMDELYTIVEQCLDEYNQTHKTQMNLVIFRYLAISVPCLYLLVKKITVVPIDVVYTYI